MPEFIWKWRREIVFSLLILISLGLLISQRKPDLVSQGLRQGLIFVVMPAQKLMTAAARGLGDTVSLLASLGRLRRENAALKARVDQLMLERSGLAEQARENDTLREELGYRQRMAWKFIPAEVVGRDPASWLERLVVNRGTADGVRRGAGVITPQGVVGRVSEVTLYSATVMLLPDAQSSVAGLAERSRVPGTLKGTGKAALSLIHVSGTDDVRVGDVVTTSSVSSIYPPGLVMGDVTRVAPAETGLMLSIQIKPRVDFTRLDRVLILQAGE